MNILIVIVGTLLIFVLFILQQIIKSNRIAIIQLLLNQLDKVEDEDNKQWLYIIESLMAKWIPNESRTIQSEVERSVKQRGKK